MPTSASEASPGFASLAGRRVLVTGASSGIGAALAQGFGACGAVVGIHFNGGVEQANRTADAARRAGGQAFVMQADLLAREAAARLVADFAESAGGLDILVNNAGGPLVLKPVAEMDDALFDSIFDLNARAAFALCRAAIPLLAAAPGSAIVNVTSLSARTGSGPGAAIYGASKAFVTAMTKTLARELAAYPIRVNALSPGFVETPLHDKVSSPELIAGWKTQIPLGRGGLPEDVVGAGLFLADSTLSGFLTGQVLEVNGGQAMLG